MVEKLLDREDDPREFIISTLQTGMNGHEGHEKETDDAGTEATTQKEDMITKDTSFHDLKIFEHHSSTCCCGMNKMDLLHFDEIPDYMKDNHFILSRYRPELRDWGKCFLTLFQIHNELGNVWTHIFGFFFFFGLMVYCLMFQVHDTTDRLVFFLYFLSAQVLMLSSSCMHLFHCHSKQAALCLSPVDYVGIAVLITGSIIPSIYFVFCCSFVARTAYAISVLVCSVPVCVASVMPKFASGKFRMCRSTIFTVLALFSVIPLIQILAEQGWTGIAPISVTGMLWEYLGYGFGLIFYAFQIPERWAAGKVDVWGQGHQIWHIFVIVGCFAHYLMLLNCFKFWTVNECPS